LDLAAACGAHHVVDGRSGMTSGVRSSIGGGGVDAVLDFVVDPVQVEKSAGLLGPGGDLVLVGAGGGAVEVRKPGRLPPDSRVCTPSWGTRDELRTLVRLARAGKVSTEVTSRALCDVEKVLGELDAGRVSGRAVLVP
jgi:propanol-preferring alcohol dehydrogenase